MERIDFVLKEHDAMYKKYCNLRVRVAPFRLKEDYEYIKTVSVIDALADRAYDINAGAKPGVRFDWSGVHYSEDQLFNRAFELLEALERGELPLKGKYTEPGVAFVDHDFIEKDGVMHVFYNRAFVGYDWPERFVDTFGHAVSTDLVNWKPCTPVFSAEPNVYDDYQVWSPGFVKHNDEYYMFYTGVNYHVAQAICMAKSKDLIHWERCEKNPVFIPGKWSPWDENKWSDCRDGMVFKDDDGKFYLYYCTCKNMPDGRPHSALGIACSEDLYNWKDCGSIVIPNCEASPESPYVLKHNGKYYMIFTNCAKGAIAYATSDHPVEGWSVLPDDKNLLCPGCTSEVFSFKGKWYMSNTIWYPTGEQYLEIAEFIWNEDGTLSVGKWLR